MRRKVNDYSGICYFWWPILNHELMRAAFRISCVAYIRALSWKPFRASLKGRYTRNFGSLKASLSYDINRTVQMLHELLCSDSNSTLLLFLVCQQLKVAALQNLVKIMSLYYQHMEEYMGRALFPVSFSFYCFYCKRLPKTLCHNNPLTPKLIPPPPPPHLRRVKSSCVRQRKITILTHWLRGVRLDIRFYSV